MHASGKLSSLKCESDIGMIINGSYFNLIIIHKKEQDQGIKSMHHDHSTNYIPVLQMEEGL